MEFTKDQIEMALEVIDHVNMLGSRDHLDDELANDIVESFVSCGQVNFVSLNNRPVVFYDDGDRQYYMYGDSFKPLSEEEINML